MTGSLPRAISSNPSSSPGSGTLRNSQTGIRLKNQTEPVPRQKGIKRRKCVAQKIPKRVNLGQPMRFGLWHEREPLLLHYCIFVGDFFTIGMTAFLFPFFISFSCLPTTECPSPFNPSSRKSQLRNIVLFSFVTRNLLAYRSLKFTVFCKRSSKEALIS